jgi:hypothetical protein
MCWSRPCITICHLQLCVCIPYKLLLESLKIEDLKLLKRLLDSPPNFEKVLANFCHIIMKAKICWYHMTKKGFQHCFQCQHVTTFLAKIYFLFHWCGLMSMFPPIQSQWFSQQQCHERK